MFGQERSPSPSAGDFDVIIHGGTVYDGTGAAPQQVDIAIRGDRIAGIGPAVAGANAKTVIDAKGLAVAPGFINMLSWSTESLIEDGRSQSEIRQGVTTEIMGEGESMGPVNDRVREHMLREQRTSNTRSSGTRWRNICSYLEQRGISLQRRVVHRRDHDSRERHRLRRQSADAGAARRDARAGAPGNGSRRARHRHVADLSAGVLCEDRRADRAVQGRGEIPGQIHLAHAQRRKSVARSARRTDLRISREANIPAEIYHIKAAGEKNWPKDRRAAGTDRSARKRKD